MKTWTTTKVNPQQKHVDIISACLALREALSIDMQFEHIKAHQDMHHNLESLSNEAKMNIHVDCAAQTLAMMIITDSSLKIRDYEYPH